MIFNEAKSCIRNSTKSYMLERAIYAFYAGSPLYKGASRVAILCDGSVVLSARPAPSA
jgi:hypothetical protein